MIKISSISEIVKRRLKKDTSSGDTSVKNTSTDDGYGTDAEERDLTKHGFSFGKTRGSGAFSSVRTASYKNSGQVIVSKVLEKQKYIEDGDLNLLCAEVEILSKIRHPNIAKVYKIICYPKHLFIMMEKNLMDLLCLKKLNLRLEEKEARCIFLQILNATQYLHGLNIAHFDLKPDNVMLDYTQMVKIIDVGIGRTGVTQQGNRFLCSSALGPVGYAPPEIWKQSYNPFLVDVFVLGVTLFYVVTGNLPYEKYDDQYLTHQEELEKIYEFPTQFYISPEFQDLVSHMIEPDILKRWSLLKVLNHEWLQKDN